MLAHIQSKGSYMAPFLLQRGSEARALGFSYKGPLFRAHTKGPDYPKIQYFVSLLRVLRPQSTVVAKRRDP